MDLTVTYGTIRDDYTFAQDGTTEVFKHVPIFIGKHGPFTERIPVTPDWALELARRVAALKAAIQSLPT